MTPFKEKVASDLKKILPDVSLCTDTKWKDITSLGIGSAAPLMVFPSDDIELSGIIEYFYNEGVRYMPIGSGTNMIGTDSDFPIVAISMDSKYFKKLKKSHTHVNTATGMSLYSFLRKCAEDGLGGAAPLAGIPGTIAGAIRMNAGARGCQTSDFVESVCGIDHTGYNWTASGECLKWGYRSSSIPEDLVITAAIWKLKKVDGEKELLEIEKELEWRRTMTPRGRSAGCVFLNPDVDVSAGKLLEISGCKGLSRGDAFISEIHANYFMNKGAASEKDMAELIKVARREVYDKTGICLAPEIKFVNPHTEFDVRECVRPMRIALLKGGTSSEREISLKSGAFVADALRKAGYEVEEIDITEPKVTPQIRACHLVIPILHGGFGEDGTLQAELEKNNIPFVGCGGASSKLCMDKIRSKEIMIEKKIPTAPYTMVHKDNRKFPSSIKLPFVVKPPLEGATFGITIVTRKNQWDKALDDAFSRGSETALVEKYIGGAEITVGILGSQPLPLVEIKFPGKIYDFDAKYTHAKGDTQYLCPPVSVPRKVQKKCQKIAVDFYNAINARDILRVDMIISRKDGEIYVLEGNNIPGFTESSLLPKAAKANGISFVELCAAIATFGRKRYGL